MYEEFFGLSERPFALTPNPRYLFLNPEHREALATLRYGFASSPGITLLLGEAGTGKTTMLRAALQAEQRADHQAVVLNNPTLTTADFFEILSDTFQLPHAGSKGRFLLAFEKDLQRRHAAGGRTALVVDEAQSLAHELFEEIRLLANLETTTAKLVNVLLLGQPELAGRLNDPSLRQLKQRIVLRSWLKPLTLDWTARYIAARLTVAGGSAADVFTRDAVRAIYDGSRGIPRTIGVICENALLAGYAAGKKPVEESVIVDVCHDLDLGLFPSDELQSPPPARAADDRREVLNEERLPAREEIPVARERPRPAREGSRYAPAQPAFSSRDGDYTRDDPRVDREDPRRRWTLTRKPRVPVDMDQGEPAGAFAAARKRLFEFF